MDFETVVKRRRTCRAYSDREVPPEKVDRILDLACRYPSAGHTEPQEFIVVQNQRVKEALARAALGQTFVAQAPLRSEEHTSELQSRQYLVCRLLLEKKKKDLKIAES